MMKLCSLFSGGKDSVMAIHKTIQEHEVVALLSMIPGRDDSYMFHYPNIELTKFCAEAICIPIIQKRTLGKPPHENSDLFKALEDMKKKFNIEGVVGGAVHSNYQYQIIKKACDKLGLELVSPYWQKEHKNLIQDAIQAGYSIIFTGVAAYGMDESWLGRKLDSEALKELERLHEKHGIDVGGEGGEYETFVTEGPIFKKKIVIKKSEKQWDGFRGTLVIKEIEFE